MICREINMPSAGQCWLMVSQVEHARVSAELARHWSDSSAAGVLYDSGDGSDVPSEVLAAIAHHDDGWARWERSPQIDPDLGRPLTYRGEVPLENTLRIWSDSIASAREYGPLAGRMVARHFMALLESSESLSGKAARSWHTKTATDCNDWLSEWQAADSRHTPEIADSAAAHLRLFDLLSLWLCCDCPVVGDESANDLDPFDLESFAGESGPFRFSPLPADERIFRGGDVSPLGRRRVVVEPWPFYVGRLPLNASGVVAPKLDFPKLWPQMIRFSTPVTLGWIFVPD